MMKPPVKIKKIEMSQSFLHDFEVDKVQATGDQQSTGEKINSKKLP